MSIDIDDRIRRRSLDLILDYTLAEWRHSGPPDDQGRQWLCKGAHLGAVWVEVINDNESAHWQVGVGRPGDSYFALAREEGVTTATDPLLLCTLRDAMRRVMRDAIHNIIGGDV